MLQRLWSSFRNYPFAMRIGILVILLLLPSSLLFHYYNSAIEEIVSENLEFSKGVERVHQLAQLQEHIAQYRGLDHGRQQSTGQHFDHTNALLSDLHQSIREELNTLREPLFFQQNRTQVESIEKFWSQLSPEPETAHTNQFDAYTQLITLVQYLMKQVAAESRPHSNKKHPERIQIYSLSTHTIPALKEQMGRMRGLTYGALLSTNRTYTNQQLQLFLPPIQTDISTHRQLLRDQLAAIYNSNPTLHQESFSLFSEYSTELAAFLELLNWEIEDIQEGAPKLQFITSPEELFTQFSTQIDLLNQLSESLLLHIDNSLKREHIEVIQAYRQNLLLLALLFTVLLTALYLTLRDHHRGSQQLRNYLLQHKLLEPNTENRQTLSNLNREHQQIWHAYHQLEEQLNHETARLFTLKQGVDRAAMILITDLKGDILYVNDALIHRAGYSEAELIGQNPRILQSGLTSKETYKRLWKTILNGKIWKNRMTNMDSSGNLFWVEETIVPLLDDQGELQEFFAIQIDITTQVVAENRLTAQVEELETKQSMPTHAVSALENETFEPLPESEIVDDEAPHSNQVIRVLAIDDESTVLDSYVALLRDDGNRAIEQLGTILHNKATPTNTSSPFNLDCSTNGEEAVQMVQLAQERGTPYQVVYLDMLMPGGWDGLRTAQEILRIDPMVRIIVVSAWSEHTPSELQSVVGDHFIYLKKPFSREELIQLTHYMAEDWRRTQQLVESKQTLSEIMSNLKESNKQRQRELDHQRIYQMILVTLSTSAPLYSGDRQAGYNEITQATLEALGVDRVTLWHLEENGEQHELIADNCYNVKTQTHQSGERHTTQQYQELWQKLQGRQVVRIENTEELIASNGTESYFSQHEIGALLVAPIFYNNRQLGIISAEVIGKGRAWRLEEATFLSYVSNLVPTIEVSAERKDAELQAEQANRAKDDFLATMSHELRTPLTSMIGYGDILTESPLNQDQQELVNTMRVAGKTLLALVNDILDISKIEAGKFELDLAPFSLESLLHEIEMMFTPKASLNNITFTAHSPENRLSTQLAGDERRIVQILINLIGNALKFTHEGAVTLKVSSDAIFEHDSERRALYHFEITDTGIGIPEEAAERLFMPFEQADGSISRSFGGTGLGLYISRVLAHLMKGDIALQSREGFGSTFTLTIPLTVTDIPTPLSIGSSLSSIGDEAHTSLKGRVLIVEDTLELQQLEQRLVESSGATVEIANDGEEGLEMALGKSYDLILMDMQMPKMDGITATRLLRSSSVSTPIVALTANVMQQHREQFKSAGCNDFLSKPIDRSALLDVLRTYLETALPNPESTVPDTSADHVDIDHELTALFKQRLSEASQQINTYSNGKDWQQMQEVIHTLKGAGASFGYPEITEQARKIEQLLLDQDYSTLDTAIEQLLNTMLQAQQT